MGWAGSNRETERQKDRGSKDGESRIEKRRDKQTASIDRLKDAGSGTELVHTLIFVKFESLV